MKSKNIIAYLTLLVIPFFVAAQGSLERSAQKNLRKHKWNEAYAQLQKAIRKDSSNVIAHFLVGEYFFNTHNAGFHIDSAYLYILRALRQYSNVNEKARERMKRFPIDSAVLIRFRERIDSAAFARARKIDTEEGYRFFLSSYPFAAQRSEAEELRDEAAYNQAVGQNTHQAFFQFIEKYPSSKKAPLARQRYEMLLYEAKTTDQRLSSFEAFLKEYPNSPYRREAEKNIFELSTAHGTIESFESYLSHYRNSSYESKAKNILYHLLAESQHEGIILEPLKNDSLLRVTGLRKGYLIPFLKDDRFGFMDESGIEIVPARENTIADEYLCGNISEDVIVLEDKVVARNGVIIWQGKVTGLDDLGNGYLRLEEGNCIRVIHKSGFTIGEGCFEDAKFLQGKLIAQKKNNFWHFFTLSGRELKDVSGDEVSTLGEAILFRMENQFRLSSPERVISSAFGNTHVLEGPYEEVKLLPNDYLWARKGTLQSVLDPSLRLVIPAGEQTLSPAFFGYISASSKGVRLLNKKGEEISSFEKAEVKEPWVVVKSYPSLTSDGSEENSWRLFDPFRKQFISEAHDSIRLHGAFAIGLKRDSIKIYVPANNSLAVKQPVNVEFLSGPDNASYLVIHQSEKRSVYNTNGLKMFTVTVDRIQYAGEGFFIVSRKEKKGLINAEGKTILPVEYDAIGSVGKGIISLLKGMKFGLFNYKLSKLIRPEYDKNIIPYTTHVLVAFKQGRYGFVDWTNKPLSQFEFAEVQHWNDSVALVRQNGHWAFYNLATKKIVIDTIKKVKFIRNNADDKLAIVQQDENFGVLHNTRGVIIPIRFSDLVNVGSPERPTYFTEKHVEEASLFVVIYYDHEGKMLRREIYEHDDYEKIYCSE